MTLDYIDPIGAMKIKDSPRKVLDFNGEFRKKRIEPVWEHTCGCQHFYLHEDGCIECVRCHEFIGKTWGEADGGKVP